MRPQLLTRPSTAWRPVHGCALTVVPAARRPHRRGRDEVPPPLTYTRSAADVAELTRAQLRVDGIRVTRGGYVSRAAELTLATAGRAALDVLPEGAVVSHHTAAALLGAPVRTGWPLTFSVPPKTYRPRRRGVLVHVGSLADGDRTTVGELPVTSGCRTWLDLARCLPSDELVAVGDALFRAGHLDPTSVRARLDRAHGRRGVVLARRWAPRLTRLAASRPESLVRVWLIESPLPDPELQVPLSDHAGREIAHADLGYARWRVALEYEGRQHAEREQFGRDIARYSLMASRGWLVLRFGEDDLARRERVVARVAGALRSRGASW